MNNFHWKRSLTIFCGLAALLWFLIRVIPKPERASYPCQRAAFPIATAFVLWVIGLLPSFLAFRMGRKYFQLSRYFIALVLLFSASAWFLTMTVLPLNSSLLAKAFGNKEQFVPSDGPNQPMGIASGINPGRVVWSHNADAASWDGVNGYYWDDNNTSEVLVDEMLSESIDALTGATSNWKSWDALFSYCNEQNGKGQIRYQKGEKVAVKINLSNSGTHGNIMHLRSMTTPALVLSVLKQLVEYAKIPDTCITVYDASEMVPSIIYDKCLQHYPGIKFADKTGGNGRIKVEADSSVIVAWSEDLVLEDGGGFTTYLPRLVSEADYIINLAMLKGHDMAGITINAKNHVGSLVASNPDRPELTSPQAAGIHPYAAVHYFSYWNLEGRAMGTYNILTDLMGHKHLGQKTVLNVVDGLYASKRQNGSDSKPNRWLSAPFNNHWTASLFISQDKVAIESVCLDFLRSEPTMEFVYGNVDNYLHEAALAHDPPSGTFYDPEGDGSRLTSLGIHEHWNNAADKMYSRDLGNGDGIQLIKLGKQKIPPLTFSINSGIYNEELSLHLISGLEGAIIYYTLDGTLPTTYSMVYQGEIIINENIIVNAVAYKDGYLPSDVITGFYFIINSIGVLPENSDEFTYYPNPVGEELHLNFKLSQSTAVFIEIIDEKGQIMLSHNSQLNENDSHLILDTSDLRPGMYVIVIKYQNSRRVGKLMRQ